MLSANVIYAVHVLLELDKQRDPGSVRKSGGCLVTDFGADTEFGRPVLRRVLKLLLQAGYITFAASRRYLPVEDLARITLLDLVHLFHGDVCIGESFDHYLSIGTERFRTQEHMHFLTFEDELRIDITQKLQSVRLSDFRAASH